MSDILNTYSPRQVSVNWGGEIPIKHFAEGTAIEVARNVDNSDQSIGMQGDVAHTFMADKTGTVSFTILQTGETNRILSAVQALQDESDDLFRADLLIVDKSGSFICIAEACHIKTTPSYSLGDSQSSKTWVFYSENLRFADVPAGVVDGASLASRIKSAVDGIKSVSDKISEEVNQ